MSANSSRDLIIYLNDISPQFVIPLSSTEEIFLSDFQALSDTLKKVDPQMRMDEFLTFKVEVFSSLDDSSETYFTHVEVDRDKKEGYYYYGAYVSKDIRDIYNQILEDFKENRIK